MKLKKEFGQHFLNDDTIINDILQSLYNYTHSSSLPLLEIGPGGAALTKYLLPKYSPNFKVVEIDDDKVHWLLKNIPIDASQIIHQDFLKIDSPFPSSFNIIGNFPYNISSQILFKILEWKSQVPVVIGMFQKEVAIRIASKEGSKDYGILSVLMQAYYDIDYLFDVDKSCFTPPPKVQSGVIAMVNHHNKFNIQFSNKFATIVKAAFAMRRKTLRNNFKSILPADRLSDSFFDKRAEQLSVLDFVQLYKSIYES